MQEICPRHISVALAQGRPGFGPEWIDQFGGDLVGIVEGGVGQDLVEVGAVLGTGLFGEAVPADFVKFGQVGLILGVHDTDRATAADDDVGNQVAERAMGGVGPLEGEGGLPQPAHPHLAAGEGRLAEDQLFHVGLPEPVER